MKVLKSTILVGISILLFCCNRQTDIVKKQDKKIIEIMDTIISIYYGDDIGEVQLFSDGEVECFMGQIIDQCASRAKIFLRFTPQLNNIILITDVKLQMKWLQNGKIIPSSFVLSEVGIDLYNYGNTISSSNFGSNELITEMYRKIEDKNNELLYTFNFDDPTYKSIPSNVERVIIELQINYTTKGKAKRFKKSIDLDPKIHKIVMPHGSRND